jgi:hypothetical protein
MSEAHMRERKWQTKSPPQRSGGQPAFAIERPPPLAVVALAVGLRVARVSTGINPKCVSLHPRGDSLARRAAVLGALAIVDLAGPLAEFHFTGESAGDAWQSDESNALGRALAYLRLRDPDEEPDGAEAAALVDRLRPEAKRLVDANWPAIQAVASVLAGRPLTGDAIDALIAKVS